MDFNSGVQAVGSFSSVGFSKVALCPRVTGGQVFHINKISFNDRLFLFMHNFILMTSG